MGCLIEHYGGAFPVWLSPVQVEVIPIADRHLDYARKIETRLRAEAIRAETDTRSERMNLKIREAQMQKIPYMLVVGDAEMANATVSVRLRSGEDLGPKSLEEFEAMVKAAIDAKT